ncbi:MAG: hypothetical protein HC858_06420, partial [Brachymonas sp.]|nr:hypothetical protein [Brachymonas sp.]
TLLRITPEPVGTNCAAGGQRIDAGVDINRSTVLDTAEISHTAYVCNAAPPKSWAAATLIESDNGIAIDPQIAVDPNGNAVAVWRQLDGAVFNIWANRFTPSGGWGTVELIETDNAGNASSPQVAIDANGNAVAVWRQTDGSLNNIWANRFSPNAGWGTAELIEVDNLGSAFAPQVTMNATGQAVAVWFQSDGVRQNIWANHFTPLAGWGTAALIETDNTGDALSPQVSMDANGNAVAVWLQFQGGRADIRINQFAPTTGWGAAALLETDNTGTALNPQVSMNATGQAIAVWYQFDGIRFNILASTYAPGQGWSPPELIETNADQAAEPKVALAANGHAVVVWQQSEGVRDSIWANTFQVGLGWGTATLIETDNAGSALSPQVAINDSGQAVAVWHQFDGSRNSVRFNSYTPSLGWAEAAPIPAVGSEDAVNPQVAMDARGNALSVWQQSGFTTSNIFANRYR